jgi:hypothetical protein
MSFPTLQELVSNIDAKLWVTQDQYEQAIKRQINARKKKGDMEAVYLDSLRGHTLSLKEKKEPVSIIKEMARANARKEETDFILAESELSQCYMECNYLHERIQTIKRIKNEKMGSFN